MAFAQHCASGFATECIPQRTDANVIDLQSRIIRFLCSKGGQVTFVPLALPQHASICVLLLMLCMIMVCDVYNHDVYDHDVYDHDVYDHDVLIIMCMTDLNLCKPT